MTVYTATCRHNERDKVVARIDGPSVELEMHVGDNYQGEAYLSPFAARLFARGILALADEIDGGEVKAEAPAATRPKVGDRLRVTRSDVWCSSAKRGDIVRVLSTEYDLPQQDDHIRGEVEGGRGWWLPLTALEPVNEPTSEPLADWERELIEATPKPAPTFADLVNEAKRLLTGTPHSAADIITLARDLADRA